MKSGGYFVEQQFSPYIRALNTKMYGAIDKNQLISQSVIEEDFDVTK